MRYVRVRADVGPVSVESVEAAGVRVALVPGAKYDEQDPLVRTYPWAFESDVEAATSEPGERRNVRTR